MNKQVFPKSKKLKDMLISCFCGWFETFFFILKALMDKQNAKLRFYYLKCQI